MNLTARVQRKLAIDISLEDLLPTRMPVYVHSVAYLWGATALSSIAMLIATGLVLSIFGPTWYHGSDIGHFVNSLHFWSAQLLFFSVILHLLTKFFMGAWRDHRGSTWVVGALTFMVVAATGLTGFLAQTSWDSEWIAVQAKDAMNAVGIGAFFNTMNTGQVLTVHIALLPAIIIVLISLHLFLVRRDSPVKPYEKKR